MFSSARSFLFTVRFFLIFCLLALAASISVIAAPLSTASPAKRVLLISIDGLRADALSWTDLKIPRLKALAENGFFTERAMAVLPARTLPNHASMLSGYLVQTHQWMDNDEKVFASAFHRQAQEDTIQLPTIFDRARQAGLQTAAILGKEKLIYVISKRGPLGVDYLYTKGFWRSLHRAKKGKFNEVGRLNADEVADKFSDLFLRLRKKPELTFVHFHEVDLTGHQQGWQSAEQKLALESIDKAIGRILDILTVLKILDGTTLIVTSDHGGGGVLKDEHSHMLNGVKVDSMDLLLANPDYKSYSAEDYLIPWIGQGPGVSGRKIKSEFTQVDTAAFIKELLALPQIDNEPPLDGRSPLIKDIRDSI